MKKELIKEVKDSVDFESYCIGRLCSNCAFDNYNGNCQNLYRNIKEDMFDVYIAAPFFNQNQITRVELVKSVLENSGLSYFSPKDDSAVSDINDSENRKKVFKLNHDSIDSSKMVIAITDDKDPGTIWEAGYAFAKGIPVIYVAFTLGAEGKFNLMLAESGKAACRTVEELKKAIAGQEIYFKGNIE